MEDKPTWFKAVSIWKDTDQDSNRRGKPNGAKMGRKELQFLLDNFDALSKDGGESIWTSFRDNTQWDKEAKKMVKPTNPKAPVWVLIIPVPAALKGALYKAMGWGKKDAPAADSKAPNKDYDDDLPF